MSALTGLACCCCVPQLAARPTTRQRRKQHASRSSDREKKDAGYWLSSHGARDSCSRDESKPPASVRLGDSRKKMQPPHAPTSSHRRPTGRVLGGGFDRRLLALRKVPARRLRPAGRLTCRVHGQIIQSHDWFVRVCIVKEGGVWYRGTVLLRGALCVRRRARVVVEGRTSIRYHSAVSAERSGR